MFAQGFAPRRVVVTGMGIASPLGLGVENVWNRLTNGESGISAIQAFDTKDLPARIADDTFCVLLSGDAKGSEVAVLSRLVEAIALHDANKDEPQPLALSVGSAIYDPADPVPLEGLLRTAEADMRPHASETR